MKYFNTIFFLLVTFFVQSQNVSNGGFETWTGSPSHPTGWCDPESLSGLQVGLLSKDQSQGNFYQGSSAVKLKTDSVSTPFGDLLLPGTISLGTGYFDQNALDPSQALTYYGTPFTGRPDSISFAIKYAPSAGDSADVGFYLTKTGNEVGGIQRNLGGNGGSWVVYTLPISYSSSDNPDTAYLFINSSNDNGITKGSILWVDDVKLIYNGPNAVQNLLTGVSLSVFPNPVVRDISYSFDLPASGWVTTEVIDIAGQTVVLQNESFDVGSSKRNLSVKDLPAGTYLLRLSNSAGQVSHTFTKL